MKGWSSQGLGWADGDGLSLRASCAMVVVVRSSWDKIKATAQCWKTSHNLLSSWVKNVVVLRDNNAAALDTKRQQESVPS